MVAESIKDKPLSKKLPIIKQRQRNKKESRTKAIITLATTTPATNQEIAKSLNISDQAVSQTLKRYSIEHNVSKSFREHRAEILSGIQEKIIKQVDCLSIKIDSPKGLKDATTAFGILYDKERIERGQATSIVQANSITGSLKDLIELITGKAEAVDITPNNDK
jgi:DNA-binding transcriptional regulator LsrR (DeoR family)